MDDIDRLLLKLTNIPLNKVAIEGREELLKFIITKVHKCFSCSKVVIGGSTVCEECTQKHLKEVMGSESTAQSLYDRGNKNE
jgi:hypothetical protein